jgi:hypothetical protein
MSRDLHKGTKSDTKFLNQFALSLNLRCNQQHPAYAADVFHVTRPMYTLSEIKQDRQTDR